MTTTPYTLSLTSETTNGTSNIGYLLDSEHEEWLHTVTPSTFEAVFGPGDDSCTAESSKGYTDPEWYWVGSDGNVWGIGWRWGQPRLRGRGIRKFGQPLVRPDRLSAYEFVEFLKSQFACNDSTHSV